MKLPDGRGLVVSDGVLVERARADGRLVLWVPGERAGQWLQWDRIGTVAGATIDVALGVCAIEASALPSRERKRGGLAAIIRRLAGSSDGTTLSLPTGNSVEICGPRRRDLILAWSEDESAPLLEDVLRRRWPDHRGAKQIGPRLWLLFGVVATKPSPGTDRDRLVEDSASPRERAERIVAEARQDGDASGEVTALVDLAISYLHKRDARSALPILEKASAQARLIGDRRGEADALSNLAQAVQRLGQPERAIESLHPVVAYAREAGDVYAEKVALEWLGRAWQSLRDPVRALDAFERAAAIACDVGDFPHEALLRWYVGIQQARLGRREQAIASAQTSVTILQRLGKPQAERFAQHLENYRLGTLPEPAEAADQPDDTEFDDTPNDASAIGAVTSPDARSSRKVASGPRILETALSATTAVAKYARSGFRTLPRDAQRTRLATCAVCEHHTGLRCRVCGCITAAKARLPHEHCPTGRWPK